MKNMVVCVVLIVASFLLVIIGVKGVGADIGYVACGSESMLPNYKCGNYFVYAPASNYEVGDVIIYAASPFRTFRERTGDWDDQTYILHRISQKICTEGEGCYYITKGDANKRDDNELWGIKLTRRYILGKVLVKW